MILVAIASIKMHKEPWSRSQVVGVISKGEHVEVDPDIILWGSGEEWYRLASGYFAPAFNLRLPNSEILNGE